MPLSHLDGKLSGWQEDEHSGDTGVSWAEEQALKKRKHEGCRLPCKVWSVEGRGQRGHVKRVWGGGRGESEGREG